MRLLLLEETVPQMHEYCQQALESYVNLCEQLYGEKFLSYNVHSLLHIVSDAEVLGNLNPCSAFVYENNMPEFPKHVRKPGQSFQQYYKRMKERAETNFDYFDNNNDNRVSQPHA